jgi:hypothetical protein
VAEQEHDVAIGVVFEPAGATESQAALATIFRKEPRRIEMVGLAGPNDTLQILFDWATWHAFVGIVAGAYFVKLAQMAAESTPSTIKTWFARNTPKPSDQPERDDAIFKLLAAIDKAQKSGNSVIVGFPIDDPKFQRRNIGIQLAGASPEELAKAAIALASIGPDLMATISAALENGMIFANVENSDCSAKIQFSNDGSCEVQLITSKTFNYPNDGKLLTIHYEPDGRRTAD